jgi:uncharacterized membrane protein YdjX (TVP38/TMEM64 family)
MRPIPRSGLPAALRLDRKSLSRIAAIALPISIGLAGAQLLAPYLPQFASQVERMGAWAPVAFVGAYVAVVVLMLPAFLLIMVGGAVFGLVKGAVLSMTGALLGGTVAFLIARHVAGEQVARRVARRPALASIDRAIGEDGMKLVFLLRLSTAVPFVLSNYALGVTRVRTRDFVVGTFGLIPTVLTYAAYGSASRAVGGHGRPAMSPVVLVVGISATVLLGIWIGRLAQKALRDAETAQAVAGSSMVSGDVRGPSRS